MHQMSVWDFSKPNYPTHNNDEILRIHAERELENRIVLDMCCDTAPKEMFCSCTEYWVECPVCKAKTKKHKKMFMAMQAWNWGERSK